MQEKLENGDLEKLQKNILRKLVIFIEYNDFFSQ